MIIVNKSSGNIKVAVVGKWLFMRDDRSWSLLDYLVMF